ncbi:hypothetical protein FHY18_003928 [Xanthomonas arboricola]|uniref:hypothetical protein n=1 Tax=Xanthomonas sp. 3793 TaxID=3035312 RepID=UPI00216940B8|nr:hypothetical protein [Xanthomonas sp. 3793]MCS3748295.1 hypothetical protein [Xanthomonas sp. 3793]
MIDLGHSTRDRASAPSLRHASISEARQVAIERMIAAGANVMTWLALAAAWQRDWAQLETTGLSEVMKYHAAGSGIAFLWEQQLLHTPVPAS